MEEGGGTEEGVQGREYVRVGGMKEGVGVKKNMRLQG